LVVFGLFVYSLFTIKSGSSLAKATGNVKYAPDLDYSLKYIEFLLRQLGLFLPLSAVGLFMLILQKKWRYIIAIAVSAVVYFLLISFRNSLFHFRYILPIVPFITIFIAYVFEFVAYILDSLFKRLKKYHIGTSVTAVLLILAVIFIGNFSFLPKGEYYLGYTAPQPDWKAGYEWIKNDADNEEIVTISTHPVFHDIYLGKEIGKKYFLSFSLSGLPNASRKKSIYANSEVVDDFGELKEIKGYLVLDEFSFRMLDNKAIKDYLKFVPGKLFNGRFKLMVWKL